MHSALRLNIFHLKCTDRDFNPDPKTLDGLCPDGAVNPDQYPSGIGTTCALSARWKKTTLRH
ncbi:hypothetical protein WRSd3_00425 [Shigella dysenteriae WRSd3]|uniref:Uncharacterized protein n=1 Tax=Shigella dysenteriae WRSd3 TaxID=1401327 RepID=A0A090NYV7_SHIDY|nr:hypothetical protein WRSd3_00425 [Shigella dysenteriae WRSd3]